MLCRHYMVRSATTILDTATLSEALAMMIKHHMQELLVVNENKEFVGEITSFMFSRLLIPPESDREVTHEEAELETVEDVDGRIAPHLARRVGELADSRIPVVHPETPLAEGLKLLAGGVLRLPVVDPKTNKLVGALSSLTILRRYRF
jgi:CBS domain-containing protein